MNIPSIDVRGDTEDDRTLRFWKPSLTLDWKGGKGWQASCRCGGPWPSSTSTISSARQS